MLTRRSHIWWEHCFSRANGGMFIQSATKLCSSWEGKIFSTGFCSSAFSLLCIMKQYNGHYKWSITRVFNHRFIPARRVVEHIRHFIKCFSRITKTCAVITTTKGIIYKTVMCVSYLHNYWRRGSANSKLTGNVWCGINKRFLQRWPTINNFSLFDLLKRFHERRVFKQQINNEDIAEYFMFKQRQVPLEFKYC
jgi:hypothetical protein